jgi:glycosyltransferase involved in cell wall biosynthesis
LNVEAVVGSTLLASFALARSLPNVPFWADQFGHAMAEAQAKSSVDGDNRSVAEGWKLVQPVLSIADKISVVSQRQRLAVVGELGAIGRLTGETCGYEFIDVAPCAAPSHQGEPSAEHRPSRSSEDEFLVLWAGSYNVWSDIETLMEGLELAMRGNPRVRFVSIGGGIEGHDVSSYSRLKQLVAASKFSDRFLLEGWVEQDQVAHYVAQADLGVVAELRVYEGELGSKNRVLEWMGCGLPVLSSPLGDLGEYLSDGSKGLIFEPGDAAGLAQQVLWAAENRDSISKMAEHTRKSVSEDFSLERTTFGLRSWAREPTRAPDWETVSWRRTPMHHLNWRYRLAARSQSVSWIRRSSILRSMWQRLTSKRRTTN